MDSAADMTWQIDFWDVGQGDATTILLPTGEYILVDAGPTPKYGNPLVQWFAQSPAKTIKSVVITHNDWDHVGGLASLAHNPSQAIQSALFVHDRSAARLPDKLKSLFDVLKLREDVGKTKTHTLEAGVVIYEDAVFRLAACHPSTLTSMGAKPNNHVSAIITLERKSDNVVLVVWGGDAPLGTIVKQCPGASPNVLFGPHHGCPLDRPKTWSTYKNALEQIAPDCIFISVGRGNTYGHPDSTYVKCAASMGMTICCSEITAQCSTAGSLTGTVFQGSGRLGYPVPPRTQQCRGTMRVFANADGIRYDSDQAEFVSRIKTFSKTLCLPTGGTRFRHINSF